MSRLMRVLLMSLLVIAMAVVSGCGGDKFVGKWGHEEDNNLIGFSGKYLDTIDIEKNGESYVLTISKSSFVMHRDHLEGSNIFNPKYDAVFQWDTSKPIKFSAKADGDNRLVITEAGMPATTVTYIEKDGTLLFDNVVYKKYKSGDVQKFKDAEAKRLQDLYDVDDIRPYKKKYMKSLTIINNKEQ